jgi:hypothetical protein
MINNYSKSNSVTISTASGKTINIDDSFIDYLDLVSSLLGIEDFTTFSSMDEFERKEFVKKYKRDNKLQEILK